MSNVEACPLFSQVTKMDKIDRRTDLDWLRVLSMLMIFAFHCARFFDYDGWHVKNNQLSLGLSVFVGVVSQ